METGGATTATQQDAPAPGRPRRAVLWRAVVVWVAGVLIASVAPSAAALPYTTDAGGIAGGGFVGVVAVSPSGATVAAGGDISGAFISTNSGSLWAPSSRGLFTGRNSDYQVKFAALEWQDDDTLYGLVGNGGATQSALVRWKNSLGSWQIVNTGTAATGNWRVDATSQDFKNPPHPRPTGHLLAIDRSANGDHFFGATRDGLLRSLNDGATWDVVPGNGFPGGNSSGIPTGVTLDPNARNAGGYVTSGFATVTDVQGIPKSCSGSPGYCGGFYRVTQLTGTPQWSRLNPPTQTLDAPQEVKAIDEGSSTAVYIAAGLDGIWQYKPASGAWRNLTSSLPNPDPAQSNWSAIDGYYDASTSRTTLYVGATWTDMGIGGSDADVHDAIWRLEITASGSATATRMTTAATLSDKINGPNGQPWWHISSPGPATNVNHQEIGLGRKNWVSGQIAIDPSERTRIFAAGRAGVWRTQITTGETWPTWHPIPRGLGTTVERKVAVDPRIAAQVASADVDWSGLLSNDHMLNATSNSDHQPGA